MRAVRIHETGGPEVLVVDEIDIPEPGPTEVRVRIEAAGLNFIDTYQRSGQYPLDLPATLGMEGAGTVDAVGKDVADVEVGARGAYAMSRGSYAEYAVVPADVAVPLPDAIDVRTAAAVMLQGMTAHYLTHSTFALGPDHSAVVLAAAGGVGHLLVQVAKRRGARVIGTTSIEEKAELARAGGADEVVLYTEIDFADEVRRLTDGRGVDVVYDSVGRTTFDRSLDCLRPRGYLVLYGQSSGRVDPVDPQVLNQKGSLFLTRPTLAHYTAERPELLWRSGDLFSWIGAGELEVRIDREFPLAEAAEAHRYIESGQTKGKVLLIP